MKKIFFSPNNNLSNTIYERPEPASKFIPDWYRKLSKYMSESRIPKNPDGSHNVTAKSCMPFFDAMTAGYIIKLPCDVYFVDPAEYGHRVIWNADDEVVGSHPYNQVLGFPVPENFESDLLKWMNKWHITTPKGYSSLIIHPVHRYDLPFLTISGIVDTDTYNVSTPTINFPFFIKKNFIGKIEEGTPIAQVIPIKRESWSSKNKKFDNRSIFAVQSFSKSMEARYKKLFWQRKQYR
jgi:hypothetical protein